MIVIMASLIGMVGFLQWLIPGGYVEGSDDIFQKEIDKQVNLAIEEADAIIFMVDVADGVTGMDQTIAELLRRSQKPIFLAINKVV